MRIVDIAKKANVSAATVSFVLNNKPGVSEETRKKIMNIISEEGYDYSKLIKKKQTEKSIRFIKFKGPHLIAEESAGFISDIIDAVIAASRKYGYELVINVVDSSNISEMFDIIKRNPLCGIIALGTEATDSFLGYLNDLSCPVVIIDNYLRFKNFNCVLMNNEEMVFQCLSHLVDLGHTDIGFLNSKICEGNFAERFRGFKSSLQQHGLDYNPNNTYELTPTTKGAYEDTLLILGNNVTLPTAFFSVNDTIAQGAMKALKEKGFKIPDKISIIGFDDIASSNIIEPPLTTIRVFRDEIGLWAVRLLLDNISNNKDYIVKVQVSGRLIKRNSTGRLLELVQID